MLLLGSGVGGVGGINKVGIGRVQIDSPDMGCFLSHLTAMRHHYPV
ncbi:unnamed protein product [marine sediment metagenome]|uniref:Uncharacterized protein n=1 Tax=marine sediment metagenome TaxID=412755 RepID=X1CY05_9ZZZZ